MSLNLSDKDVKELLDKILKSNPNSNKNWEEGKKFLTKSGIKVRSKIEKIIADFYFDAGIKFEYEKKLKLPKMQDPTKHFTIYCDFYLTDYEVFHEHFGLNDKKYNEIRDIKKSAFSRFKFKFIYTDENDEDNIEEAIARKLKDIGFELSKD